MILLIQLYFDHAYQVLRTYGFYVTSSRTFLVLALVLIEGNKIGQLWDSVSVQICGCGYVRDLIYIR